MSDADPHKTRGSSLFEFELGPAPTHDPSKPVKISVEKLNFWYGADQALIDIDLTIHQRETIVFIGPSGCGKSTLLRCLNRANDLKKDVRTEGRVTMDGVDLYSAAVKPQQARRRFGWIAQKPNPFPSSIFENIAYGPRLHRLVSGAAETEALVENMLRRAGLWNEVNDRLGEPGTSLSGGQQQRLCIARALAHAPEVLLMDEPCSALDPTASAHVEALIDELRDDCSIVVVTHNMQHAARVAQRVAVLDRGRLVEVGDARQIFEDPQHAVSRAYLKGEID